MKMVKVIDVKPLHGFVVSLEFSDGLRKDIDLEIYLHGEVFEPIRNDPELFRSVRVEKGERTISWPNGADIDPYTLYYGLIPEWNDEDDALAAALEQRRSGIPMIPSATVKPEIEVR